MLATLVALAVLVRGCFWAVTGATFEDAYISLRYAENLANGLGLVYNPGQRVFGASTPLYVLFLSGLTYIGAPALTVAKFFAVMADGATLWLWGRFLLRRTGRAEAVLFLGLLFGLSPLMVQVGVSGMETAFALLLLTLVLLGGIEAGAEERPLAVGIPLGLLALVRPEGALAGLVVVGLHFRNTGRLPWRTALIAGLLVLPWLVSATLYYGTPVPHSIPAKAAAYNLHRPSPLPNLWDTLSQLAPIRGPWSRWLVTLVLLPCLLRGVVEAWRDSRLRALPLLFFAWWAYLVLPKTLLFTWYYPPFLLAPFVLAALGFAAWMREPWGRWRLPESGRVLAPVILGVGLVFWLGYVGLGARRIQRAENGVRRQIGVWLRENTPEDALIAMEPIGYIGYYSRRPVLDEVGLVSPELVPLNRAGAGWFAEMLRKYRPDYVVERPEFLRKNATLNSKVPMFANENDRREFEHNYEKAAEFGTPDVPKHLLPDYQFAIYRRR